MNSKDLILKLKQVIKAEKEKKTLSNSDKNDLKTKYDLNLKIADFIKWSGETLVKDETKLRHFIEKAAIWYELRYPDVFVYDYFYGKVDPKGLNHLKESRGFQKLKNVLNSWEQENLESGLDLINWDDYFDLNTFFNLTPDASMYFQRPKFIFSYNVYKTKNSKDNLRIYFTRNGKIKSVENYGSKSSDFYKLKSLVGEYIFDVLKVLERDILLERDITNLKKCIETYYDEIAFKEGLLDCILYKIIMESDPSIKIERAYLFAKEFKRDLSIPLTYISWYSQRNKELINQYLKDGGSLDIPCCDYYYALPIAESTLKDVYNGFTNFTEEEKDLHKKIVNILNQKISNNQEELLKERNYEDKKEIEAKRLVKKLNRSRGRKYNERN